MNNEKAKYRLDYNRLIVKCLAEAVEKYPDQRFQQLLQNLDIVLPGSDQFYQESVDTFLNMNLEFLDIEKV